MSTWWLKTDPGGDQVADGSFFLFFFFYFLGGAGLTVAFGQRVVTVVLRSAEPSEGGENNHKKHKVTECQRQTESRGDQALTANQHAAGPPF